MNKMSSFKFKPENEFIDVWKSHRKGKFDLKTFIVIFDNVYLEKSQ